MTIISGAIGLFIMGQMNYGLHYVIKENYEESKPQVKNLFIGFNNYWKCFLINLLQGVYILLWTLLFIIPGIIKGYSYSMAFYILAENPDMTANEAITESREIMNGHKWELFVLGLSFILWAFAIVFTLGIAAIYVEPYMQLTITNFYHNIKRQPVAEPVAYDAPVVEAEERDLVMDYIRRCHGVTCVSGSDYVSGLTVEERKEVLAQMPWLPYGVIVKNDFDKVLEGFLNRYKET